MKRNIDSSNDNSDGSKKLKILKSSTPTNPIPVSKLRKWRLFRNLDINFIKSVRLAFVFKVYDECSGFLVTTNDDVYALGNQLNPEAPEEELFFFKDPIKVEELCQKSVVDIFCRDFLDLVEIVCLSFAAITKRGELYTWGVNGSNLGHGNSNNLSAPTLVNSLAGKPVKQVVMNSTGTLALLEDGQVYSWGKIDDGKYESTPKRIDSLSKVKSIGAGQNFFCALQDDGMLYTWGQEPGKEDAYFVPKKIKKVPMFEKIVCGTFHTLALSIDGELFIWGDNENNQLGLGMGKDCKDVEFVRKPMKIEMENVSDIAMPVFARSCFNACRTVDGDFYIWGRINQGKKGKVIITKPFNVSCKSFQELFCDYSEFQETHEAIRWDSFEMDSALQFEMALVHQDKNYYSDVVFVVGGKDIHACKSFLIINSEYFAAMFANEWKETKDNIIKLGEDIRHEVFFALLFYLCSKDIILTKVKDLKELMSLSDCYLLPALQRDCEIVLKQNVTAENVVEVYVLASESHLQDFAFQFMKDNWKKVAKTKTLPNLGSLEVLANLIETVADLP